MNIIIVNQKLSMRTYLKEHQKYENDIDQISTKYEQKKGTQPPDP